MSVNDIAQLLYDVGFYDVVLPFLFVFTIVYAVLQKSAAFGTDNGVPKKNVNALVAFVVGFLFVASVSRVASFELIGQRMALALVAMVMVGLVLGAFGQHLSVGKSKVYWVLVFIITISIFVSALGFSDYISGRAIADIILTPWLVMVAFFLGVVWFIVRDDSGKSGSKKNEGVSKKSKPVSKQKSSRSLGEPEQKEFVADDGTRMEFDRRIPGDELYK